MGLARIVRGLLFGVTPFDAATVVGVAVLVTGIAFFACLIPARRAARIDPMVALRAD